MQTNTITAVKLIIFFFSITLFSSYVLAKGELSYINCIVFICLLVYLLLTLRRIDNTFLLFLYAFYSIFSTFFPLIYTKGKLGTEISYEWFDYVLILLQITGGYWILKHTKGYVALMATILTLLNVASGQADNRVQYIMAIIIILLFCISTNYQEISQIPIDQKMFMKICLLILITYNIYFGIVFLLEILYKILNKHGSKKTYLLYPIELTFLTYILGGIKGYTIENSWNMIWDSFSNVFRIYSIYTIIVFVVGIMIFRNDIKIKSGHALNLALAIGILISLYGMNNSVLSFFLIVTLLLAAIIPTNIRIPSWSNYLLLSYGITISSIYLAEYLN